MGLINRKKKPAIDEASERVQLFFDEYFREELKKRGREYFEQVIDENAALFKKDLDLTIAQVYSELKTRLTMELDEQFAEYGKGLKEMQDTALQSLNKSVQTQDEQHRQLSERLEKNVANQEAMLSRVFEENMTRLAQMQKAQETALQTLNDSIQALQEQHQQLSTTLRQNVATQETMILDVFEKNMAKIVEHYLLGALGDQYDMKAQLPSIIKQMEANKQAMVDDMKL